MDRVQTLESLTAEERLASIGRLWDSLDRETAATLSDQIDPPPKHPDHTTTPVISSLVSRTSTAILALGGLALLFASDTLLPLLLPAFPPSAGWLGQCVAAGWLSVALFNWNSRDTMLGGIHGRPAVNLNLMLYLVSALALLKAKEPTLAVRLLTVPLLVMAVVYAALLLRGPFDRSFSIGHGST